MEEIAAMLTSSTDFALMSNAMSMLTQHVHSSLPEPPVATAAPLSCAAAASAPDGVDRISRLPEEILRNVVSRLPAKDAARTTVLSGRWRRVWRSAPLVLVDAHLLPSVGTSRDADLTALVSRALTAHPGPFRCVYLTGTPMDAHRAEIAHWLQLLAAKRVRELVFVNRARTMETDLQLPATLFRCTYLTRLYIGFWRFPDAATLPPGAAFPSLRELGLCSLVMDDRDLSALLDRCPILQKLIIVGNRWPVLIRIQSDTLQCVEVCTAVVPEITVAHAPGLERLLLWQPWGSEGLDSLPRRIRICYAPTLRILGFLVPGMHQLEIGNTIIEAGTEASPNTTVPSVQMLAIQVKLGACNEARMLPSFLRCFPNVETLYIQSENDEGSQSSSPSTGKLNLKFWEQTGPILCIQRRIKMVVLREFRGKRSELVFLKFIAERAKVLEKMVIWTIYGSSDQVAAKLRTVTSAKWASKCCTLVALRSPFQQEGTPWCYLRAFDLSIQDPFDPFDLSGIYMRGMVSTVGYVFLKIGKVLLAGFIDF